MGKLVKFDRQRKPVAAADKTAGDAQILIFTGVRYERGTSPSPNKSVDPSRPRRKRG